MLSDSIASICEYGFRGFYTWTRHDHKKVKKTVQIWPSFLSTHQSLKKTFYLDPQIRNQTQNEHEYIPGESSHMERGLGLLYSVKNKNGYNKYKNRQSASKEDDKFNFSVLLILFKNLTIYV